MQLHNLIEWGHPQSQEKNEEHTIAALFVVTSHCASTTEVEGNYVQLALAAQAKGKRLEPIGYHGIRKNNTTHTRGTLRLM